MNGLLEIVAGGRGGGLLRKEAQKGGRLAADSAAARDDAFGERGAAQRVDDGNAGRRELVRAFRCGGHASVDD